MRLVIVTIVVFISFTSITMAGPSVKETVDYINEILQNPEKSRKATAYNIGSRKPLTKYQRVYITHNSRCNISIKQEFTSYNGSIIPRIWGRYNLKLEKYKLEYMDGLRGFGIIAIEDRKGMNSIKNENSGKTDNLITFSVDISGTHKEKTNKALKHLSNICYQKYGSKKKELF